MYRVMYKDAHQYVSDRDGVFYYVRRVPHDVRQQYASSRISFSLRTKSHQSALRAARSVTQRRVIRPVVPEGQDQVICPVPGGAGVLRLRRLDLDDGDLQILQAVAGIAIDHPERVQPLALVAGGGEVARQTPIIIVGVPLDAFGVQGVFLPPCVRLRDSEGVSPGSPSALCCKSL